MRCVASARRRRWLFALTAAMLAALCAGPSRSPRSTDASPPISEMNVELTSAGAPAEYPNIVAAKTHTRPGPDGSFEWTIAVRNDGLGPAIFPAGGNAVIVVDDLPPGATYTGLSLGLDGIDDPDATDIVCDIFLDDTTMSLFCIAPDAGDGITFEPGEELAVTFSASPDDAVGSLTNPRADGVCEVDSSAFEGGDVDEGPEGEADNACSDTVRFGPDLVVDKTHDPATPTTATGFAWTIGVRNDGTVAATFPENSSVVVDDLPAGPAYGPPTVAPESNIECAITGDPPVLSCVAKAGGLTLAPDESFEVSFDVSVDAAGALTNPREGGVCRVDPSSAVAEYNDESLGVDNNSCAPDTVEVQALPDPDADEDGFPASVDCDDNDATVNPGAPEIPGNAVDENCDGIVASLPGGGAGGGGGGAATPTPTPTPAPTVTPTVDPDEDLAEPEPAPRPDACPGFDGPVRAIFNSIPAPGVNGLVVENCQPDELIEIAAAGQAAMRPIDVLAAAEEAAWPHSVEICWLLWADGWRFYLPQNPSISTMPTLDVAFAALVAVLR